MNSGRRSSPCTPAPPVDDETNTNDQGKGDELAEEGDGELRKIIGMLRASTGVDFANYKPTTLQRRIKRRMMLLKLATFKDYASYLKDHRCEVDALFQDVLIHVTGFFRDPEVFEILKTTVFPSLVKNRPAGTPIRLWVAGCSSGEEVYSLAMALLEFLSDSSCAREVQVFATDVSDDVLDKARLGVYPENIASEVSPERLRRFFIKVPHGYRINKSVRESCIFARHDIAKDPPFSHLDLISCRNLLIYLGPVLQTRILPIFHYALKPQGYLLLGGSETIGSFADYFSLVDKKHKIYAKKGAPQPLPIDLSRHSSSRRARLGTPDTGTIEETSIGFDVQKEADRILLNRYTPAGVIIDDDFQILQFRGWTGRYLEPAPGHATLNLTKMAREGLLADLRTAVQEAKRHNRPVRKQGVQLKRDGRVAEVDLEVIPIKGSMPGARYFLVLFQDVNIAGARGMRRGAKAAAIQALPSRAAKRQVSQLKEELAQNKNALRSIIEEQEATNEELRSANEEILTSNEELQSTNEELETAKEELQSANEELTTLNEELQNRNQELRVANNDLLNLLGSVNIPILMLGNDLRVRRFTPSAQKLLNLIPSDAGRPIGNIKMNFDLPGFEKLILDSIDKTTIKELEIQDREGHWYSMRIRPYKTSESKIEGAVITWVEVTKMKKALNESTQRYQFLFERNLAGIFYTRDNKILDCNDAFARMLGYTSREEVLKAENFDIHLNGKDQGELYDRLMGEKSLSNAEVCLTRKDGTPVWVQASVNLYEDGGAAGIIVDVTRRVHAERQLVNLSNYLMKSADDRRRSLSRELHDQVGSRLAGLTASLSALERTQGVDEKVRKSISECRRQVQECATEIQTVSYLQHPLVIDDLGLAAAAHWYAKDFSKRAGVNVKTTIADSLGRLPRETEIALYRIIQECLTNIQVHSGSPAARIRIDQTVKDLLVEVRDFGKGFDVGQEGVGITGMRERMKELGGSLEIKSGKKGTTVRALLPLASLQR